MPQITLPDTYKGETVVGGISFTAGVAHAAVLSEAQRELFEFLGGEVIDAPEQPATGDVSVDFEKLTKPQILEQAAALGLDLDPKLKHSDLVEAITAATAPDEVQTVTAPAEGDETDTVE